MVDPRVCIVQFSCAHSVPFYEVVVSVGDESNIASKIEHDMNMLCQMENQMANGTPKSTEGASWWVRLYILFKYKQFE